MDVLLRAADQLCGGRGLGLQRLVDAAGTLRHVLGRMSRPLAVLLLTGAAAWTLKIPLGLGGWLGRHGSRLLGRRRVNPNGLRRGWWSRLLGRGGQ